MCPDASSRPSLPSRSSTRPMRKEASEIVVALLEDRAAHRRERSGRLAAARALGEGMAAAQNSDDVAAVSLRVLVQHLGFSQGLLWAGPAARERRLLASAGKRPAASRVFALDGGELTVGLLEVDTGGDLAFLETLLPWIAAELARRLRDERGREDVPGRRPPARWSLTPRQCQIAALVANGLGNKEIAVILACSATTVEDHLTAIYRKAAVRGRGALLVTLLGEGGT